MGSKNFASQSYFKCTHLCSFFSLTCVCLEGSSAINCALSNVFRSLHRLLNFKENSAVDLLNILLKPASLLSFYLYFFTSKQLHFGVSPLDSPNYISILKLIYHILTFLVPQFMNL